jgi:hypothetical protein
MSLIQQLLLHVFPHGGQGRARRNAWAGMVRDASLARSRREASAAMERAHERQIGARSARG